MTPGDRIYYTSPTTGRWRQGTLQAISGVSALIQFDDYAWPQWAPLARLQLVMAVITSEVFI